MSIMQSIWTWGLSMFKIGKPSEPEGRRARPLGRTQLSARKRSASPSRKRNFNINTFSKENIGDNTCNFSDDTSDFTETDKNEQSEFLYMPVKIDNIQIVALIDTGSSVNVISQQLFDSISVTNKQPIQKVESKITLANNQSIEIIGTTRVKINVPKGKHWIQVYVLTQTSHPLILGTNYLLTHKIVLNFSDMEINYKNFGVKSQRRILIPPSSEMVVFGKVKGQILYGTQGICTSSDYLNKIGILAAKAVVTVNDKKLVPVRLLNATNKQIVIPKGKLLSKLEVFNSDFNILSIDEDTKQASENTPTQDFLQNIQISDRDEDIDTNFLSYFDIPDNLNTTEKIKLQKCLQSHKDLFVTEENPDLGYTEVVQHKISLKPDYRPKYHKPYRLPPDKKEALREHLDELLRQNIIAPVHESESVPITSPIVLVSKRNKPKKNSENQQNSYLSQYRFCCDFRYLNSQINDFCYNIPDLQDLTESFSQKTPNYLTSIDLSSGFFQLPIHPESQRYTAFNTCYGTFKFLRLPMGLSSSPSSFQLLMDKVLHGLTFKICLCYLRRHSDCIGNF